MYIPTPTGSGKWPTAPTPAPPRTHVRYPNDTGKGGAGNTDSTGTASAAGRDWFKQYEASRKALLAGSLINPPLNPLSESPFLAGRDGVSLQRGLIRRVSPSAGNDNIPLPPEERYQFRFLYNPTTLDFSNASFAGVVPPGFTSADDHLHVHFPGQEQVSFTLMLDRTQDVYEQGLPTRGTQVDIDALYRVINGKEVNPGFLYLSAVEIFWGPTGVSGGYTQNGHPLEPFPCYITGVTISHTQFTPRMCPMRSLVTITANSLVGGGAQIAGGNSLTTSLGGTG